MNTFLQAIAEGASRIGGTSTHFARKNDEFSGWRMRCPVGFWMILVVCVVTYLILRDP